MRTDNLYFSCPFTNNSPVFYLYKTHTIACVAGSNMLQLLMQELKKNLQKMGLKIGEHYYINIRTGERTKATNFIFTPQSGNLSKPLISALQKRRIKNLKSLDLSPPDFYLA